MTLRPFGPESPFYDAFESDPLGRQANYFGALDEQPGLSPNAEKFFAGRFNEVQNLFFGRLGSMIRGGGQNPPTPKWTEYLDEYFQPGGRGQQDLFGYKRATEDDSAFAPLTRWNVSGGPAF